MDILHMPPYGPLNATQIKAIEEFATQSAERNRTPFTDAEIEEIRADLKQAREHRIPGQIGPAGGYHTINAVCIDRLVATVDARDRRIKELEARLDRAESAACSIDPWPR